MGRRQVRTRAQNGFTLIELMVVVAIIGILSGLAVPILSEYRDHAKIATARTVGQQILNSFAAYSSTSPGNALPDVATCDDLAQVVTQNGYDFSLEQQARYCPVGTSLDLPPRLGPRRRCICWDAAAERRVRYRCGEPPPPECGLVPAVYDMEVILPMLELQQELYLVASTFAGVKVVGADDLPPEDPTAP